MKQLIDYTVMHNLPACLTSLAPHIETLWAGLESPWCIETGPCDDNAHFAVNQQTQTITINDNGVQPRTVRNRPCVLSPAQICTALEGLRMATLLKTHNNLYSQTHPTLWPLIGRVARADRMAVVTRIVWEAVQQDPESHTALWRAWLCGPYAPLAQIYGLMARACPEMDHHTRMAEITRRFFTHSEYLQAADRDALVRMEHDCNNLNMYGDAALSADHIRHMTPALHTTTSYLGDLADDLACDKAAAAIIHPFDMAHMRQILSEVGVTHIGALAIRDPRLAARLGQTYGLPV